VIRYRYQTQIIPPAPFVLITVRNPQTGDSRVGVAAQLDTAADRTVVPDEIIRELALPRTGTVTVVGIGGSVSTMALHRAELTMPGASTSTIEVAVSAGEPWILVGRDILNGLRIVLDGPQLLLEIE
jgi:predicted aspartyl protease